MRITGQENHLCAELLGHEGSNRNGQVLMEAGIADHV